MMHRVVRVARTRSACSSSFVVRSRLPTGFSSLCMYCEISEPTPPRNDRPFAARLSPLHQIPSRVSSSHSATSTLPREGKGRRFTIMGEATENLKVRRSEVVFVMRKFRLDGGSCLSNIQIVTAGGGPSHLLSGKSRSVKPVNREGEMDLLLRADMGRSPAGATVPRGRAAGRWSYSGAGRRRRGATRCRAARRARREVADTACRRSAGWWRRRRDGQRWPRPARATAGTRPTA